MAEGLKTIDRLEREREFHNDRFTEETRTAQGKYYWAVDHAYNRYKRLIQEMSEDADIFELGCAKGENIFANPVNFKSASGVDISDVAVKIGNERALSLGADNIKFICGDAENIHFPSESIDLVYGSGIIHHLNVTKAAHECYRSVIDCFVQGKKRSSGSHWDIIRRSICTGILLQTLVQRTSVHC